MFDVYLEARSIDPRSRSRLMLSALAAAAACTVLGGMLWTGSKLGITRVGAPQADATLLVQGIATPLPPPAMPASPKGTPAAAADERLPDEATPNLDPDRLPEPELEPAPTHVWPHAGASIDGRRGVPDGILRVPGGAACVVPPCAAGSATGEIGRAVPPVRSPPTRERTEPIEAVKAHAIFAPDPAQRALAQTLTGRTTRQSGRSTVSFCIDERGKVTDVRTRRRFSGDPQIDQICRETVSRWRFRPFLARGRAHRTCTETTFHIQFE